MGGVFYYVINKNLAVNKRINSTVLRRLVLVMVLDEGYLVSFHKIKKKNTSRMKLDILGS